MSTRIVRRTRTTPVNDVDVDICVVGSGAAGISAALEAAKLGRRVAIVDGLPALGGQAVNSIIGTFCGLFANGTHGYQFTHGIADDIMRDLSAIDRAMYFRHGPLTTVVYYDEVALGRWVERSVQKAGIVPLVGAVLRETVMEGRRITALKCATRVAAMKITHVETPLDAVGASEKALEGKDQADRAVTFLKTEFPKAFGQSRVRAYGFPGIRQTRWIQGVYQLTAEDVMTGKTFNDAVPEADNLVAAGRCMDGDAAALSSVRVMGPCMAMGAAAAHALDLAGSGSVHQLDLGALKKRVAANVESRDHTWTRDRGAAATKAF